MTRKEAIHELQEDKRLYETDVCHAGDGSPDGRLLEALDMAIEALSADTVSREHHDMEIKELKHQIKDQTDMVSVVRCKDCRHAEHRKQMPNQVYCKRDKLSTFCAVHDDDDFCKYGERREE